MTDTMLTSIEAYYDAVPRNAARAETLSPFTLFVNAGAGWPYYARPELGATTFTPEDVTRVRARQRELGVPESFEWVAETTPALRRAIEAAGLAVSEHPLMVLVDSDHAPPPSPPGVEIQLVSPDDDLATIGAVAHIGFGAPGTEIGGEGTELLARVAAERTPEEITFERMRLAAGETVVAVALAEGQPVGIGSYRPVGAVTEIAGVATLPAFRRRGIAAALTHLLVKQAKSHGVRTVFLTAADDAVAHVYQQVGFRRIATACIAEPPSDRGPH